MFGALVIVGLAMFASAAMAVFVFGVGDIGGAERPSAEFAFEQTNATVHGANDTTASVTVVTVTHDGGGTLAGEHVDVLVDGKQSYGVHGRVDGRVDAGTGFAGPLFGSTTLERGDSASVVLATDENLSADTGVPVATGNGTALSLSTAGLRPGETIRVIYEERGSEESFVLGTYTFTE